MITILLFIITFLVLMFKARCCVKSENFMDISDNSVYFYDSILFDDSTFYDDSISVNKDVHYLKYI